MSSKGSNTKHVRVGVGVLVQDPTNKTNVYAGIRRGSHGSGTLALPGGHLEMQESWEECAIREVKEEMGLDIHQLRFIQVTNDPMPQEDKHYITIFMTGICVDSSARPQNLEPNKCLGWNSYSWDQLRNIESSGLDLFGPLKNLIENPSAEVLKLFGVDKRGCKMAESN